MGGKWLNEQRATIRTRNHWTHALRRQPAEVMKLFKTLDENEDSKLSRAEFRSGIRMLKLDATANEINQLFDELDVDKSDTLSLGELRYYVE